MIETQKVDNNTKRKAFFVSLRPLYVTDVRYLEPEVSVSFYCPNVTTLRSGLCCHNSVLSV